MSLFNLVSFFTIIFVVKANSSDYIQIIMARGRLKGKYKNKQNWPFFLEIE
jgi:hypothetical protein